MSRLSTTVRNVYGYCALYGSLALPVWLLASRGELDEDPVAFAHRRGKPGDGWSAVDCGASNLSVAVRLKKSPPVLRSRAEPEIQLTCQGSADI